MRLLNVNDGRFKEFSGEHVPKYAILSHRWGQTEVSHQEYVEGFAHHYKQRGLGHRKISRFRSFVKKKFPYEWIWIDTCCIDKKSSAELTESINSMYKWYSRAAVCIVYLKDLPPESSASRERRRQAFLSSNWFRRGWTLQELLAPSEVIFCDKTWEIYGDKKGLLSSISKASGISKRYLDGREQPKSASIATRMSWVSNRHTMKPEDRAYCLLGLFQVNMPLLYGEGNKAFLRLQLEIIRQSDDESIFAWVSDNPSWGMLAPSPDAFRLSGDVQSGTQRPEERMAYQMTNKGLNFWSSSTTLAKNKIDRSTGIPMGYPDHTVELACYGYPSPDTSFGKDQSMDPVPLAIDLERVGSTWRRVDCGRLKEAPPKDTRKRSNGTSYGQGVQRLYIVSQPDM